MCLFTWHHDFTKLTLDASCQWNKCGFEISWLWHEHTVFHFPTISMYCCSKLSYIYSIFIVYYSAGMLFFLTHFLKKVMCLFTYDLTILRKIDIGCIVVIEIDVILKLLTWAWKYNILFHKNKTILLLFKSFFVKVFTFVSMLAFHIRV
jgi:hypothetical protein